MSYDDSTAKLDDYVKRQNGKEEQSPQAVELGEFLSMELPPREWLIDGLIQARDAAMVHSWRGFGKSRFAHGLALALAAGGRYLRWEASEPRGSLIVDGELPREDLQAMLAEQVAGMDGQPDAPVRVLARDLMERLPPLISPEGQRIVEDNLDGIDLVVLDNLSTLGGGGNENDADSWDAWQEWLLRLRRLGIASLLVHHDGKGGSQRGTSRREDVLSQVIQLRRPTNYQVSEGARFEVHLTKARHVIGEAAEPIEAQLRTDQDGRAVWTWQPLADGRAKEAKRLKDEGLSQREIAQELGVSPATVNRDLRRAKA